MAAMKLHFYSVLLIFPKIIPTWPDNFYELKYDNGNKKEINISFHQIWRQMAEIGMLQVVKTQSCLYLTYVINTYKSLEVKN